MLQTLEQFGASGGALWMFREETEAAELALSTGVYRVWRSPRVFECVRKRGFYVSDNGLRLEAYDECFRVGPRSRCFCGHPLSSHMPSQPEAETSRQQLLSDLHPRPPSATAIKGPPTVAVPKTAPTACKRQTTPAARQTRRQPSRARPGVNACNDCSCRGFAYIPSHPDAIAERWLAYRRDFVLEEWAAKCKCKHTHLEHKPAGPFGCRQCGCSGYSSAWECLICDCKWQDHEVFTETEAERRALGLSIRDDFRPLNEVSDLQRFMMANLDKVPPGHASHPVGTNTHKPAQPEQRQRQLGQQQQQRRTATASPSPGRKTAAEKRQPQSRSQTHCTKVAEKEQLEDSKQRMQS